MRTLIAGCILMSMAGAALAAEAPSIPGTAKQLTEKSAIVAALTDGPHHIAIYANNGQVFNVESTFDWQSKSIHVKGENKVFKWNVKGDKYCVAKEPCRTIYVDGGKLYEVDPNGKVHAVHANN